MSLIILVEYLWYVESFNEYSMCHFVADHDASAGQRQRWQSQMTITIMSHRKIFKSTQPIHFKSSQLDRIPSSSPCCCTPQPPNDQFFQSTKLERHPIWQQCQQRSLIPPKMATSHQNSIKSNQTNQPLLASQSKTASIATIIIPSTPGTKALKIWNLRRIETKTMMTPNKCELAPLSKWEWRGQYE